MSPAQIQARIAQLTAALERCRQALAEGDSNTGMKRASNTGMKRGKGSRRIFLLGAAGDQKENGPRAVHSPGPPQRRSQERTMAPQGIFFGQETTPARRGAAGRRTGKDPPARLLLPGGLTQARKARKILRGSPSHNATCRRAGGSLPVLRLAAPRRAG